MTKDMNDFIREHRDEIDKSIREVLPNMTDVGDKARLIYVMGELDGGALIELARKEGHNV